MKKIVILISGRGSNMEAIIRSLKAEDWPAEIAAVISNTEKAAGLATAENAGIATEVVSRGEFSSRQSYDTMLSEAIDRYAPDLVVLAGFMRILTAEFVRHYEGRIINIHPSLLPAFTGLHTHERAIEAGVRLHGATVHFVTPELDAGPIIAQAVVPVLPDDTEASLAARVLEQEHRLYPRVVRWFVEGKVRFDAGRVRLDDAINTPAEFILTGDFS
ncbi:phosphoribosylglycinamide formyltransferase [Oxalobacter vibrioformis]|uniref:Phosphoribosylglycinamide formyltransferase n=1 Tax=Oxalobacter vibrioformis TaxID=933080 RepID=A0A9E9LWL3_9BURK|nr:phosphoribosylglycinamide formyltransferase [Oxalobacter vibrioformis]NLC24367.1 phosphoribosylglycinamide formyltransferase [Oxalobacter sp.]WAW10189.1 phosphoribosylglycinamide formyltransferase [Oxalobacter vibrioformis]